MATQPLKKRNQKPKRPSNKQLQFEKNLKWRLVLLAFLAIILSSILINFKTKIVKVLVESQPYEANRSSEPESRVYDAINYSFNIRNSEYKREQLFRLLDDPVEWYNYDRRLNGKFPSGAKYDLFRYLVKPDVEQIDFGGSNYEINFHGVYRYRQPVDSLLAFESGVAIIKNGLITSLTTERNPNEYHLDWLNMLWQWYAVFCIGLAILIGVILLFARVEKDLLFSALRRWLRV